MAARIALAAAGRSLRRLAEQAPSPTMRDRVTQLATLAEAAEPTARELSLGDVTGALFPGDADPVGRFRAFRRSLRDLAGERGVELACEVDGHKHAPPHARRCWFTGTDDGVRQLELLSEAATTPVAGEVEVRARARRAVRVCIDGIDDRHTEALSAKLRAVLAIDRDLDVEVSDTRALAGESPHDVRSRRLAQADVAVCLLSPAYLAARGSDDLSDLVVVPVAMEHLGSGIELRGFHMPFALEGTPFASCRRKDLFVATLRDQIAERLNRSTEPDAPEPQRAQVREWGHLVPDDDDGPIVEARARRTQLDRRPPSLEALDDTVDVQDYLRDWADGSADRPYLVIFGEYGMGKTTASQVFTRRLLERRGAGDGEARLPIYLDLRRLGDVKHEEPTLRRILDDLLQHVWEAGGAHPAPTADEVVEQVQRHRAVVIFDGLDEVLVHLRETQGQALLRELWKILPPPILGDPVRRKDAGRVVMTCRTHFFRTLRDQHTYFRGEDREIVGADSYAALHLLPFTADQVRAYFERRETGGDAGAVDRAVELIRQVHDLTELVQRPFNLRLVADQLGALERRIASGERVNTAALYEELVATWLDRDQGKHQLPPRRKIRLMGELAAELWREGRRSLPVDRLEAWLERRLDCDDELRRWFRLERADLAVVAEDLRTATFVVRPAAEDFQFAHTSLLEYFLALHLAGALAEGDGDAWALPMISPETFDFLGEIIDGADVEACRRGLRGLRAPYRAQASELAFTYCVRALARGAPAIALAGFSLEGAKLRGIAITGPPGGPMLPLTDCALAGADLREACLRRVRVERCDLSGARLVRAELHDGVLDRVDLDGADMAGTIVRGCRLASLDLRAARAHRTQWLGCTGDELRWPDGDERHLFAGPAPGDLRVSPPPSAGARLRAFTGHTGGVMSVAWSADNTRLASAGSDGSVRIWDAGTGEQLHHLSAHTGSVRSVAWSADNTRLASAGDDGSVRIWDAGTGEQLHHLSAHTGSVMSVAWSADNTRLASAGDDGSVRIWDAGTGEQLHHLSAHTGSVRSVAWSADNTRLASAGYDGSVRIWDAGTGEHLHHLSAHTDSVMSVAWSADNTRLASAGDDGSVRIWDAGTGEQLHHLSAHTGSVMSVAWSADNTRLASAGDDGSVRIWDAGTGEQLHHLSAHTGSVTSVAWSADNTRLASAGDDGSVRIWDAGTGEQLHHLSAHTGSVMSVAWSADNTRLASAGHDGSVRIWDAGTGEHLHHLSAHTGSVRSVAWSADNTRLASAGDDGSVRIWDAGTGEQLHHLSAHTGSVMSVAWSADNTRLASAGHDGSVRIWDAGTGEQLHHLSAHTGSVMSVAWSADNTRLASAGDDGSVRIWDAGTGEQLHHLSAHTGSVMSVAWSADNTRLASAGNDGSVRIWDAGTGEHLHHLSAHTDWVMSVAWSADNTRLASAGDDGSVRIWDAGTGEHLHHLSAHTGSVMSVAWSADNTRLASAGNDGSVRIWDGATGAPVLAIHLFDGDERAVLAGGRVASCSAGAWRWLGWIAPSPLTGVPTRYPAEVFGPLPVHSPAAAATAT